MADHFTQASVVRDAVIAGSLDELRPPARWLAEHQVSDTLPETWTPHVVAMQRAASTAAAAETVAAAAAGVGAMAQACGACHSALGGPTFGGMSPEGKESSVAADMQRHLWAADRMWEGLVGPSDTAWQAGVVALADAQLAPEAMADDRTLPKEVFALAEQAHEIGAKGGGEKDPAKRAELYGRYLGTCAACHAEIGVEPPPSPPYFELEPCASREAESKRMETAMQILDDGERQALLDALDDEYRAWATYDQVVRDLGPERPFINILDAEARHIQALRTLFQCYALEVPENTWPGRIPRFASIHAACEAGIAAEVANAALYERLMRSTSRQDILMVFANLRRASQEHHLPAFRRCATRGAGRGARRG